MGVATAWFRRLFPTGWIYMHVLANLSCFLLTLIAFIIWLSATVGRPYTSPLFIRYNVIGSIIMIFVTVQVINGFMRPPVEKIIVYNGEEEGFIPRSPRAIWQMVHKYSGVSLLILSVFEVQTGLTLFSELFGTTNILPLYWTTVIIFVMSVSVIKLSMVCHLKSKDRTSNNAHADEQVFNEVDFSNARSTVV